MKYISLPFLLLLSCLLFTAAPAARAQDAALSVIVNPDGTQPEMTGAELKKILRGEKQRWKDGAKVTVALMKTTTPVGQQTAKKLYGMSGDELNKYWLALVFQGRAKAPNFFNTERELADYVAATPGAIGVVQHTATGTAKMARIDGKEEL